jgi:hypothetical protein
MSHFCISIRTSILNKISIVFLERKDPFEFVYIYKYNIYLEKAIYVQYCM